jgi:hypothetical protein
MEQMYPVPYFRTTLNRTVRKWSLRLLYNAPDHTRPDEENIIARGASGDFHAP